MILGAFLGLAYIVTTVVSQRAGLLPIRPLYEGGPPPAPYAWVTPPPERAQDNKKASSGQGDVTFDAKGEAKASNVNTDDGQAVLIIPPGGIAPKAGETKVHITMTPLDPVTVGSPPKNFSYDGNAYRMDAVYPNSGATATIPVAQCPKTLGEVSKCATIVLRFVYDQAADIFRRENDTWVPVHAQVAGAAMQAYGDTNSFGTFVAMDGGSKKTKSSGGSFLAFALGLAAILIGTVAARWRAIRKARATRKKKRKVKPQPKKR